MSSTVYDVRVNYGAFDTGAGRNLTGIADAANLADQHTIGLTRTFKEFAAAAIGGFGLHEAKKHLIGFNEELQNLNISTAAQLEASDLAPNFQKATEAATGLVQEFQRFSKLTPVTTRDIAQFAAGITAAVGQAGGGIRDIQTVAEQGVIAAKVFGAQADYASLEITEMIQRGATVRMRFAKQLLASVHETQEHFNALSEAQRLATIEKALTSKSMTESVGAFSKSFTGVVSTLEDNLQLLFGRVGMPLFEAITKEIAGWNGWIDQNGKLLDHYVKSAADALVDGFRTAKGFIGTIVEHKDFLLTLARAWLVAKGAGMGIGMLQGTFGAGARMAGGIGSLAQEGQSLTGAFGKMGQVLSGAGGVIGSLVAFYEGLQVAAEMVDTWQKRTIENAGEIAGVKEASARAMIGAIKSGQSGDIVGLGTADFTGMSRSDAVQFISFAREHKAVTDDLQLSTESLLGTFKQLGASEKDAMLMTNITADAFRKMRMADPGELNRLLGAKVYGPDYEPPKRVEKPHVNVTIQHVEVASDDPDRFVFAAIRAAEQLVKAPVTADRSIRGH